jgi:tetratricopeptide (TPR) repeat protein
VLVEQQFIRLRRGESAGTSEAALVVDQVVPVFERDRDEHGLCEALRLRAWLHWVKGQADAAAAAWEQAAAHARLAGVEHERIEILGWVASALLYGPTPVAEGIRRGEAIREEVSGNVAAAALVLQPLAGLHAMQGRFARARELLAASVEAFEELGLTLSHAVSHTTAGTVELLAGDPAAAEACLRRGYDALEAMGDTALRSTTAALLGQALLAQGRDREAAQFAELTGELAAPDDLITQVLWRCVLARTLADRGDVEEGVALARDAVALAETSDFVNDRGDALFDLARVLTQAGRGGEARTAFTEALRLYGRKENTVAAGRARAQLAELAGV